MPKGTAPPNLRRRQATLQTGVVYDAVPWLKHFGDVMEQPSFDYNPVMFFCLVSSGADARGQPPDTKKIVQNYAVFRSDVFPKKGDVVSHKSGPGVPV